MKVKSFELAVGFYPAKSGFFIESIDIFFKKYTIKRTFWAEIFDLIINSKGAMGMLSDSAFVLFFIGPAIKC